LAKGRIANCGGEWIRVYGEVCIVLFYSLHCCIHTA